MEVVAQARDGEEALMAIHQYAPDLLFLDTRMPGLDAFGLIDAVGVGNMPLVIFVTAYDQHALRAFDVRALDYLLKPFDRERFGEALERARRLLAIVKDQRRDQPTRTASS